LRERLISRTGQWDLMILSLETENYPEFVVASILETAEVLKRMLDKANFDSGRRKVREP